MHELIKITPGTISNQHVNTVNARDLHNFLDSRQDFSTWIKSRIKEYDFIENQDFILLHNFMERTLTGVSAGGHNRNEYILKIDMAKELSMVERTPKGKQARQYFIECEKIALNQKPKKPKNPIDIPKLVKKFKACKQIAKTAGLKGQDAVVYANSIMQKNYGEDPLALLGIKNMGKASYTQAVYQTEKSINDFIDQCCITGVNYKTKFKVIYCGLEVWWKKNSSNRVPTQKKLGVELGKRFERAKSGIIWYHGVDLKIKIGGGKDEKNN